MAVSTYYFDASDGGPTDLQDVWLNDANAFDGDIETDATATTTSLGEGINNLRGDGTNAPASGGEIISLRARLHDGTAWDSIAVASKTTYYLNTRTNNTGITTIYNQNSWSPAFIRAVSDYF